MTPELKAAVERLRKYEDGYGDAWRTNPQVQKDAALAVAAYLAHLDAEAKRAEEDVKPVTEEWLRENGLLMEQHGENIGLELPAIGSCCVFNIGVVLFAKRWQIVLSDLDGENEVYVGDVSTIGQLNHLIAALGGE